MPERINVVSSNVECNGRIRAAAHRAHWATLADLLSDLSLWPTPQYETPLARTSR
ncbi:hypothetical protein ACFU99_01945 [Streptomyces sp. NPDC057654]|uniref:hypothetical protein n=1 Tax=Streptomyces sp. NPDC057654 TaxID=3346196 RepID=UPI00367D60D9